MTRVAIVGGGPSGLYALKALVAAPQVREIALFEAGERWGVGTPYDPRVTPPNLLANIASFELPPLVDTLTQWLAALTPSRRYELGVGEVSERAFYPRVALGAYFEAQFAKLVERAGERARTFLATRVRDVVGAPDGVEILYERDAAALAVSTFDFVIVATGHRSRPARKRAALTAPAYPPPRPPPRKPTRAALLGASLSAIDACLTMARERGDFVREQGALVYRLRDGAAPLRMTMLSRRGVLPEADFYFPYPYQPLRFLVPDALAQIRQAPKRRLDLAFDLLRRELAAEDPDWASRIALDTLTADSFADAYFAQREGDPFACARRNLARVRRAERTHEISRFRYALLRAHEAFAELTPAFSARDRKRFRVGLQRVFVDNYAAVPPFSVERLIALHEAGALDVQKVAPNYRLEAVENGVAVVSGERVARYDFVVDARGERAAAPVELPFATLRLQILANSVLSGDENPDDLAVTDALALAPGVNPVDRVYCLAAPFLLGRRPFAQGLTSARDMAERAVADLVRRAGEPTRAPTPPLDAGALYLDGIVVTCPDSSGHRPLQASSR